MTSYKSTFLRFSTVALVSLLLISGCSGSSDSSSLADTESMATDEANTSTSGNNPSSNGIETDTPTSDDAGNPESNLSGTNESEPEDPSPVVSDPISQNTTRVNFEITVPAYQSDALQVGLTWGDLDIIADWVSDESWSASDVFPTATEHLLVVSFYDENGGIVLASVEQTFRTGTNVSETVQIVATQFDSERWDDDNDGISNLAELLAGSEPLTDSGVPATDTPSMTDSADTMDEPDSMHEFEEFNFIEVADELLFTTAGCQMKKLTGVVEDLAYIVEDTNTITWPGNDWYQVQIVSNSGPTNTVYATICDGDAECKVLPGRHAIINHTTGERTLLEVLPIEVEDNPNAVQLPETVVTTTDTDLPAVTIPLTRVQHACERGGTFTREMGEADFDDDTYQKQNFIFDQCEMTIRTGRLPDGNYQVNGSLEVVAIGFWSRFRFENLSIVGDSGLEYHVQNGFLNSNASYNATVTVTSYEKKLSNEQVAESLMDIAYSYRPRANYRFSASGVIRNDKTANQHVTIRTDATLNYELGGGGVVTPFNGSMEMLAEDGSILHFNPVPMPTEGRLSTLVFTVDLDATTRDGENITGSIPSYRPGADPDTFSRTCGYRLNNPVAFRRSSLVETIP